MVQAHSVHPFTAKMKFLCAENVSFFAIKRTYNAFLSVTSCSHRIRTKTQQQLYVQMTYLVNAFDFTDLPVLSLICVGNNFPHCEQFALFFAQRITCFTDSYVVLLIMSRKLNMLYVGGLDDTVTEEVLHAAFIPFGDLKSIQIPKDYKESKISIHSIHYHIASYSLIHHT